MFTFGLSSLIVCFIYNKLYINGLLEKGYTPASEADRNILVSKGFIANIPISQHGDVFES